MRYFIIHYTVINKGKFVGGSFGMEGEEFPREKDVRKAVEETADVGPNGAYCTGITEVSKSDSLRYILNAYDPKKKS